MLRISPLQNICTICSCSFIHKKSLYRPCYSELFEVILTTCHPKCKKVLSKYNKLKEQLLEAEWKLYTLGN